MKGQNNIFLSLILTTTKINAIINLAVEFVIGKVEDRKVPILFRVDERGKKNAGKTATTMQQLVVISVKSEGQTNPTPIKENNHLFNNVSLLWCLISPFSLRL